MFETITLHATNMSIKLLYKIILSKIILTGSLIAFLVVVQGAMADGHFFKVVGF